MLASLSDLGYSVEWRVVNAADYGFPQKRRRVFIVGRLGAFDSDPIPVLTRTGVLARGLPVQPLAASMELQPDRVLKGAAGAADRDFGDSRDEAVPERRGHDQAAGVDPKSPSAARL